MKKLAIHISIAIALGATVTSANAINVEITEMNFLVPLAAEGLLLDSGNFGALNSIDPFKGFDWSADGVAYFDGVGVDTHWTGTTIQGSFDYQFTLQAGQVAWGMLFEWNSNNDIPVLNIMDCGNGNVGDICTGVATPMQTGPFSGSDPSFNGIVATPLPAASWLMLSGLVGLAGYSRHNKKRKYTIISD